MGTKASNENVAQEDQKKNGTRNDVTNLSLIERSAYTFT